MLGARASAFELLFEGIDPASLVGTSFDLFDWTGVAPIGVFGEMATESGTVWSTPNQYSTGGWLWREHGDFDGDGGFDGLNCWRFSAQVPR